MTLRDFKAYLHFPSIRKNIRRVYAAKLFGLLTLVVFSPLILIGLVSIVLVFVLDYLGQWTLHIPHTITEWLREYQNSQISASRSIVSVEEIQNVIGPSVSDNVMPTGEDDEDL